MKWWYLTPLCLVIIGLAQTFYDYHERTSEQVVEEPIKVMRAISTEIPVGRIKCVHTSTLGNRFCEEYVIYRTIEE